MGEKLQALPVGELRKIAKENGIKSVTTLRKQQLIDMILEVTESKRRIRHTRRKSLYRLYRAGERGCGRCLRSDSQ